LFSKYLDINVYILSFLRLLSLYFFSILKVVWYQADCWFFWWIFSYLVKGFLYL
jgi:hypothetical protein